MGHPGPQGFGFLLYLFECPVNTLVRKFNSQVRCKKLRTFTIPSLSNLYFCEKASKLFYILYICECLLALDSFNLPYNKTTDRLINVASDFPSKTVAKTHNALILHFVSLSFNFV